MLITYAMVIAVFIIVEIMISTGMMSSLMQGLLVPLCIYSIVAIGLNLCVGYLGELSLGHAGFMCVGAFSSAVFSKCMMTSGMNETLRFILALLIGTVVAAVFGWLIGIPVLRLRGDYLAIVTLAFGEIIKNVVNIINFGVDSNGWHFSTKSTMELGLEADGNVIIKGAQGISGTPKDANFTVGVILVLLTLFIVQNLIKSRDGRAIMAIRDNRIAAESVGINITKYKLMVFTISASLAGAAGALYSHNYATLTPAGDKFNYNASIMILVYVVLGGIGNIRGSVIAAIVLYILPEKLRFIGDYRMLVYAIVLIIVMLMNWAPKAQEYKQMIAYKFKSKFGKNKEEAAE